MIEQLTTLATDPSAHDDLLAALDAHAQRVAASTRAEGARRVVDAADDRVRKDVAGTIRFDGCGTATVHALDRPWAAGRFTLPSLGALRREVARAPTEGAQRLFVLYGEAPMTDVGALQAFAPPGTLFQVASQFNCLESPGAHVTSVQRYLTDPTQGPRASVSALPGTLVRHFAAPAADGRRFTQSTHGEQVDLLADLCDPEVARVCSGYLRDEDVRDPQAFLDALQNRFEAVRVGLHTDIEVVLGAGWAGEVPPDVRVAQVFTSTFAAGYSRVRAEQGVYYDVCRLLLRAAYLGTLLGARYAGQRTAVLTLIGGGVFSNPVPLIWESILWAFDESQRVAPGALDVVVNGRNLASMVLPERLCEDACARGGAVVELSRARSAILR